MAISAAEASALPIRVVRDSDPPAIGLRGTGFRFGRDTITGPGFRDFMLYDRAVA